MTVCLACPSSSFQCMMQVACSKFVSAQLITESCRNIHSQLQTLSCLEVVMLESPNLYKQNPTNACSASGMALETLSPTTVLEVKRLHA